MSNPKADPGQDPKISIDSSFARAMMYPIEDYDGRQQAPNVAVYPELCVPKFTFDRLVSAAHRSPRYVEVALPVRQYTHCYRCKHHNHYANECYADYDIYGNLIHSRKPVRVPSTGRRRNLHAY